MLMAFFVMLSKSMRLNKRHYTYLFIHSYALRVHFILQQILMFFFNELFDFSEIFGTNIWNFQCAGSAMGFILSIWVDIAVDMCLGFTGAVIAGVFDTAGGFNGIFQCWHEREQTKQKPVTLFFTRTCGKNEEMERMDETYIGSRG